ncbi:MAG TPA: lysylphosphatidylglycerol synthase transmembrane domain-containing protein [Kofleriaceae bacterium]|nr:lysylphosphatidylglycerol synthase transmembrane domain-containing protein [Kofleriaceae bacterium]
MAVRARQVLTIVIALVAVVAAFALVGDVRAVRDRLDGFAWWALAAALGLALVNYLLRFVRWQLYLRDRRVLVPAGPSALVFVAGFSMGITPGKVGELLKAYLLRELRGVPVTSTAAVVINERVNDLLALLVVATIGVAVHGVAGSVVVAAGVVIGLAFVFLLWRDLATAVIDLVTRPARLRPLRPRLVELHADLVALSRPSVLVWSTALAMGAWAAEGTGFALVVNGFPGAHIALGLALVIYAATTIAGAISFLPGGLGVTEGAMTLLLVRKATGVDKGTATAATLVTRFATLWFAVALGAVALFVVRRRISRMARA